jgi:glyoxylase-like metal-dependent hydrolase (beta-lactamase superfamily II)
VDALGPIDLHHQGAERVIGCYVLETSEGLALNDCGPSVSVADLLHGLEQQGLTLEDIDHLLLSHIHLDHAGAAGVLVRKHPGLRVHVFEVGAPHLVDPSRLERSARRLYGDAFDKLWGELAPVPEENIALLQHEVLGLEAFPTPGHASHHACYLAPDGTLYAGDAAGVRIQPDRYACPPTPPPEFDLNTWLRTIDEIERREPTRLALIHFGIVDDPGPHLDQLRRRLHGWAADDLSEEDWLRRREAEREAESDDPATYERAMPLWQSYAGLRRYWDKLAETGDPTIASRNAST